MRALLMKVLVSISCERDLYDGQLRLHIDVDACGLLVVVALC